MKYNSGENIRVALYSMEAKIRISINLINRELIKLSYYAENIQYT